MDKLDAAHYNSLEDLLEEVKEDTMILAINILLENKYTCKKIISTLPNEKLGIFKQFPIYNLYENIL